MSVMTNSLWHWIQVHHIPLSTLHHNRRQQLSASWVSASHTTIDLTPLLVAGYQMKDAIRTEQIETASGIIEAHVFVVKEFSSLDIHRQNIEICAYDFLAYHLLTDFEGVLGLDFFENVKFCIDMQKNVITTQK